jgi:putative endonuclease
MFYVYVIQSEIDNRLYKGHTADVGKRVEEHNAGRTRSTRPFRPWKLVYKEEVETKEKAIEREKYLKSGSGRELIAKILAP